MGFGAIGEVRHVMTGELSLCWKSRARRKARRGLAGGGRWLSIALRL